MPTDAPIPRITWQALLDEAATYPPEITSRQSAINYVTALYVVRHYLGVDWITKHTSPFIAKPGFLRQWVKEGGDELVRVQGHKIVDLGEHLLNLQHVEGFDSCVERLKGGDIEPILAELAAAAMLYVNDHNFRFVEPTGEKRSDFDYEITLPDGLVVCADAKCKVESTELSEKTIRNALNKALSQLPDDQPGIVIIKFPPGWLTIPGHVDILLKPTNEFFRATSRVVSVAFYTSVMHEVGEYMAHSHLFMEVHNKLNKFDANRDWRLFNGWHPQPGVANAMPAKWLRLINFPNGF